MDNAITITEDRLTEVMAEVCADLTNDDKFNEKPGAALAMIMMGGLITAKVCRKLFHEDEDKSDAKIPENAPVMSVEDILAERVNRHDSVN